MTTKEQIPVNNFKDAEPRKKVNVKKSLRSVIDGSYLGKDFTLGFIPYVLFLALLAMIYISNIYKTEDNQRKINRLQKEVDELKLEHVTTEIRILSNSQRSTVINKVRELGLQEPEEPPYQISVMKP